MSTGDVVGTADALATVEAFFGAGVSVAPMQGATLLRYLPAMDDPWSNGLHLDEAPDLDSLTSWLSSWAAFERPGHLRWVLPVGVPVDPEVAAAVAADGLVLGTRSITRSTSEAGAQFPSPSDVTISAIEGDAYDWAGFEVLARWADPDVDPARWRWRANRVRHLVEGGRGQAWIARSSVAPVGIAVRLISPDHRGANSSATATIVHGAHRERGIGRALAGFASHQDAFAVGAELVPADAGVDQARVVEVRAASVSRPSRSD